MAFGLSAGATALLGSVAGPLVGGLLGSQSSGNAQTQQQTLDPRIQAILHGNGGGDAGLLGDANNLRKQQLAQGGLNDYQRAGLEMQRQQLMSPQFTQGYDQMRNVGSQLMNAGVAGNPFANGGNGSFGGGRAPMAAQQQPQSQMQPFQYQQNPALMGGANPVTAPMPYAQPAQPASTALDDYLKTMGQTPFIPNRGDR